MTKRVLDELAEAFHTTQPLLRPRAIVDAIELRRQFQLPIGPRLWHALGAELACILPPLKRRPDGQWTFPSRCSTIWDLAGLVAKQHPDWQPPGGLQASDWREAQVFTHVRACLVEALNVDPEEVARTARLQADLGA